MMSKNKKVEIILKEYKKNKCLKYIHHITS